MKSRYQQPVTAAHELRDLHSGAVSTAGGAVPKQVPFSIFAACNLICDPATSVGQPL